MSRMSASWQGITLSPDRLEWSPEDRRKVEHGGSLLGEGTFGSVYLGEMDGGDVAIKVIKAPNGPPSERTSAGRRAAEEQHAREIRRLTQLRFKHVVQCYGVSPAPNSSELLIITECLHGGSLHQSLERARRADAVLTDTSFLTISTHIAKGLRYIHNSLYIHGDMKPHNVLLNVGITVNEAAGVAYFPGHVEAKVADFGMSKRLRSGDSLNLAMSTAEFGNQPFGTYAYMAPESFHGVRELDDNALKAVDVFAFGVLAYEMLSGMSPWKFEGVATPMQLQRLVVFEKRRPSWGTRVIRPEYKHLVELCWHDDARRRPTSKELSITFDRWLKESRVRESAESSPSSTSASTSSGDVGSIPSHPSNGAYPQPPPPLPTAPTIIRNDPAGFTRVLSRAISPGEIARQAQERQTAGSTSARSGRTPPATPAGAAPGLPRSPDTAESNVVDGDLTRLGTDDLPDVDSVSGGARRRHDERPGDGEGSDGSVSDSGSGSGSGSGGSGGSGSSGRGSGGAGGSGGEDGDSASGANDSSSGEAGQRERKYWEKCGPSIKYKMMVRTPGSRYDIGESVANEVGKPSVADSAAAGGSGGSALVHTESSGLENTMGGIQITRVETQVLKEPDRPQLDLPAIPGLPSADIFNTGANAPNGEAFVWGGSMLDAVAAQNGQSRPPAPSRQPVAAVSGMVDKFEALSVQAGGDSAPKHMSGGGPGRSSCAPASGHAAAMAAMGMELEIPASAERGRAASAPADVNVDAEIRSLADADAAMSPQSDLYRTAAAVEAKSTAGREPNGHVVQPAAGQALNASAHGSVQQVPGYPAPPRQQTLPNTQRLYSQPPVRAGQQAVPAYPGAGGPAQGASTVPNLHSAPRMVIGDVLQLLQNGDVPRIMALWEEGHAVVLASALSRDEQRTAGPQRVALLVTLLRKVTVSQFSVKSATNAGVARDLCIALGNVSRGGSIERQSAELALPTTLSTMQAFTWDMDVYSAACYALANVLKVSNEIVDDRVRHDVADWISHATSFNLNNSSGPQPTLAYTTAAAARNFIWRKAANATAFFARRREQRDGSTVVHASAAENMCKSMLFFQTDPTVVEACLSAFAALAYFPTHRVNLISIGAIGAVARVMDRPTNQQNAALLTMGLAALGIIVARQATAVEANQIVDAFVNEGGVRCVVKVLGDAVRARNSRVMEEGLYALASVGRFDQRLGQTVVQKGGVAAVLNAVFCTVEGTPEQLTPRSAEVMCDVIDVLSQHAAAASTMRQTGLFKPLQTLLQNFPGEPRVTGPGKLALARLK